MGRGAGEDIMKAQGEITGMRLKAETEKDEDGRITGTLTSWVISLRVPSQNIDANELEAMVGERIWIGLETHQIKLPLAAQEVGTP